MRARLVMPLCLVGLLVPNAAQADRHHGCYPRRSLTVAENRKARFFVIRRHSGLWYYGCLFSQGRPRGLRENPMTPSEVEFGPHKLAGGYIAYTVTYSSSQSSDTTLERLALRTGRTRSLDHGAITDSAATNIERFLLTRFGTMVWVRYRDGRYEVRRFDRRGIATLDAGADDVATTLHLIAHGRGAAWENDGEAHATLLRR